MNRRSKQNRYTPRAEEKTFNGRKWLIWALVILVILFFVELLRPSTHHLAQSPTTLQTQTVKQDAPTFEFYKVLPKASLASAHLDNLSSTTQALPAPQQVKTDQDNATYTLQFASLKDVDQAGALAEKINQVKDLGSNQAEVVMVKKGNDTWYIVKIGPFTTRDAAENIQDILDRHYLSGRIFENKV